MAVHASENLKGDDTRERNLSKVTMKPKRVLIVDDEEVVRRICAHALTKMGCEIRMAENGLRALEKIDVEDFDLVLSDLKMPLMGGMELLQAIKRDYPHVEVIILTGFATVEDAIEAMKKGASDFLLKPVDSEQLRLVVEKCFEKIDLDAENKQLRLANLKLRELKEMKERFMAITSHELRTPLSHIKGYLSLLSDGAQDLTEAERQEFWHIIWSSVEDLERIVDAMYTLSRVDSGLVDLTREELCLSEVIEQTVKEFEPTLKERNLEVTLKLPEETPRIPGDRLQVKKIVGELVHNAIKFTPDGGRIEIRTGLDGNFCQIVVKDTGVGIPDDALGKIFERFYEVQNPDHHHTSRSEFLGGGPGLGLSIARALAEAHGGGIKVVSEPHKGSEFVVYLPITVTEESHGQSESSSD